MIVNQHQWEQLRECCLNDSAFAQLQGILNLKLLPYELELSSLTGWEELQDLADNSGDSFVEIQAKLQSHRYKSLSKIIGQINQCLELETLLKITTEQLQQYLKVDRVAIVKWHGDTENIKGKYIAETVLPEFRSLLNFEIKIEELLGFNPTEQNYQPLAVSDIDCGGFNPLMLQWMRDYQVKAKLGICLYNNQQLWGCLWVYDCHQRRDWQPEEIEFVRQIAQNLEVALRQIDYIEQVQEQAKTLAQLTERQKSNEQQKILYQVIEKIRNSLDISTIFNTTAAEVRALLNADRVVVYRFSF
ncbi:MAG: GAF domain-containing protein [Planktothrix sp. GU0601_MAG3]|nr:MAG: GAF domain-containing protein [Planktothrix sp. GU0601_MAG3]